MNGEKLISEPQEAMVKLGIVLDLRNKMFHIGNTGAEALSTQQSMIMIIIIITTTTTIIIVIMSKLVKDNLILFDLTMFYST